MKKNTEREVESQAEMPFIAIRVCLHIEDII